MLSVGLEMEMPVAEKRTGLSYAVRNYFENLYNLKTSDGGNAVLVSVEGRWIALKTGKICSSIDNGFNILESSVGPFTETEGGLTRLYQELWRERTRIQTCLNFEEAMIINFSQHPNTKITPEFYYCTRAPKPVYEYWNNYRGWNHKVGIDAKAQNSPSTEVGIEEAVKALNVILSAGPAFIALYANSPFEDGKMTGLKENRLTIWPRMFANSIFPGDRKLHGMPARPFYNLRDYFNWMFGDDTRMQFIINDSRDYKQSDLLVLIRDDPPFLSFLQKPQWEGRFFKNKQIVKVKPAMKHLEQMQFSHFADARIRYAFTDYDFPVHEFLVAMSKNADEVEALFAQKIKYSYIEGRAPGANFADSEIMSLTDADIARSVEISPSALQKGLINNLQKAKQLIDQYCWNQLIGLREEAIRNGLQAQYDGLTVSDFCKRVLEIAGEGLAAEESWMLAYPEFVLASSKNGADRALAAFDELTGSVAERIQKITLAREMKIPDLN